MSWGTTPKMSCSLWWHCQGYHISQTHGPGCELPTSSLSTMPALAGPPHQSDWFPGLVNVGMITQMIPFQYTVQTCPMLASSTTGSTESLFQDYPLKSRHGSLDREMVSSEANLWPGIPLCWHVYHVKQSTGKQGLSPCTAKSLAPLPPIPCAMWYCKSQY